LKEEGRILVFMTEYRRFLWRKWGNRSISAAVEDLSSW